MHLLKRATCSAYWALHPNTRPALALWVRRMESETYASMGEIQAAFASARPLNGERVRFEIGSHRLIAAFNFPSRIVFVKFIGTHAEYDRVDALQVNAF